MTLVQQICDAIRNGKVLISRHATRRLFERRIEYWQLEASIDSGKVAEIRPDSEPNATIVVVQELPNGTEVNVVWAWLPLTQDAMLVTVHFFGEDL
jgi:hypothetical protein